MTVGMSEVFGVEVVDVPTGWTVLGVVVIAQAIDSEGRESMFTRTSEGMWDVLALGMVTATQRSMADDVAENMIDDPEATDEGDDGDDDE